METEDETVVEQNCVRLQYFLTSKGESTDSVRSKANVDKNRLGRLTVQEVDAVISS